MKKQLFKNDEVFILFTPRKIVSEPHKEVSLNMQIIIDYPDELIAEFILLPSLTRHQIEGDVNNYKKGDFYEITLFNESFSDTLTIEKNTGIVSMYFVSDTNYSLNIKSVYTD